ncbi:putative lipid II flippase FtsW [Acetatifactor muris]|uniref:Probable peptidoglycan glycosyltransferase FtsW n=1 Tax=Acetatifactor muris TaxID=879566 RepID=A0A2K4ZN62_9FIRM|nr:putative peptidoglycan glycosyltransferase FtsW [Acetatifactor muris]MCI8799827.1 cell division protein FtsW [Lachnospiraceae bacterium]MCR2050252.1 putative lipid II flippase FtsW [Acetatifactor muris]SOY31914.1 Lipid II flippase FtsW [Acetatifactor muris]
MAVQRRAKRKKKEQSEYFFDYSLLFIVLFLLGFGLVMIYSASSYTAFQSFEDAAYYLKKQLTAIIIGLVLMIVVANIPYHFWERFALLGYLVSMALVPLVKTPLGVKSHGATRWIRIPGIGLNLQPAEVAKLCLILFLAVMVCKMGKAVRTMKGFLVMVALPLPVALEIYVITKNLSSAIIVLAIAVLMVFVASPDYKKFILMALAVAALATLAIFLAVSSAAKGDTGNFRFGRILAWLDPESDSMDTGFQTLQGLYAIGSGGIWGRGLGQSIQKLNFIPESQNDMIFSIICEELGLFGAVAIIVMFIMLLWRMMVIANNAPDLFGAMLVVGVMGHIAVQSILNIAVVTNTIPNTGISLPFISYGGSSVMFLLIEIGLVLSVARRIQLKEL